MIPTVEWHPYRSINIPLNPNIADPSHQVRIKVFVTGCKEVQLTGTRWQRFLIWLLERSLRTAFKYAEESRNH